MQNYNYGPVLNGTYGLSENYVRNKKNEATEIINCLNGNFEKLLLLFTGSNDLYHQLYEKEMKRNNNNMINIDDNLDQIFYFFKNITQKLDDIESKQFNIKNYGKTLETSLLNIVNKKFDLLSNNLNNIEQTFEKKVIELKAELNTLSLELNNNCKQSFLHSLDSKIELLNINIEELALSNSVTIQRLNLKSYETHTNVLDLKNKLKELTKQLYTCDIKQENDALQFDYGVINHSFIGVNVENKTNLAIVQNIIDLKYIPKKKNTSEYDKGGGQTLPPKSLSQCFPGFSHSKTDICCDKPKNLNDIICVKTNNKKKRKRKKKKGKDIKIKLPDTSKPPDLKKPPD